jgi:excisionase family DNA binding protein
LENHFTPGQAAEALHVSDQTICRWLKAGKLTYVQVSERRRLIPESELQNYLNRRVVASPKKIVDPARNCDTAWKEYFEDGSLKIGDEGDGENGVKSLETIRKEIERLACQ